MDGSPKNQKKRASLFNIYNYYNMFCISLNSRQFICLFRV